MSYIGKEPQYTDFLSKFFSGDGTAMTVTLDASPPNEAALLVFIDGVRQDTSAYTVSGYSLTFTGAVPSGTNNVQVVHLGIAQDTQVPVDDSVSTAKIQDDAVTSAKLDTNITIDGNLTVNTDALIDGDLKFDSGYGSTATAYGCRAWVNFNGSGTVAIRDSGNVSSITDNGTGDYTVNLTTAMPDINYAPFISNSKNPDVDFVGINTNTATGLDVAPTTTTCRISFSTFGVGGKDPTYLSFAIFR